MKNFKRTLQHSAHSYSDYEQNNLERVPKFHQYYNSRSWDSIKSLVIEDVNVSFNGKLVKGSENFISVIQEFKPYIPNIEVHDLSRFIDGNVVIQELLLTGNLQKDFETPSGLIKANNQKIEVDGVSFFTFNPESIVNDVVVMHRFDQLFEQLNGIY